VCVSVWRPVVRSVAFKALRTFALRTPRLFLRCTSATDATTPILTSKDFSRRCAGRKKSPPALSRVGPGPPLHSACRQAGCGHIDFQLRHAGAAIFACNHFRIPCGFVSFRASAENPIVEIGVLTGEGDERYLGAGGRNAGRAAACCVARSIFENLNDVEDSTNAKTVEGVTGWSASSLGSKAG
jgi:hypothetical protein